jgi:hypothetical protein
MGCNSVSGRSNEALINTRIAKNIIWGPLQIQTKHTQEAQVDIHVIFAPKEIQLTTDSSQYSTL